MVGGPNDIDRNVMRVDEQIDWSGGMNLIDAPDKLAENQSRIVRNFDGRNRKLEKMKGQRPESRLEIGAFYYDKFDSEELNVDNWAIKNDGVNALLEPVDGVFKFIGADSGNAWDTDGLLTQTVNNSIDLSYTEIELTTPAALSSITRFRIQLAKIKGTLESDNSLEIEFDESGDVIRRENGTETDTGFNWAVATTYRIRLEKQNEGWKFSISAIPTLTSGNPTIPTSTVLFTTSFEGHLVNFIHYQVFGGTWLLDEVVNHEGFVEGSRKSGNGVFRFYRETELNETIVFANTKMYKRDTSGYATLEDGFDINAKWTTAVHLDQLICCNGADSTKVYDGSNVVNLGTGVTQAPIAKYVIVHLQTPFIAGDPAFPNTLYRADITDFTIWDTIDPLVDIDAWNGDIITGFVKLGPSLFIIKSNSVWELIGTTNANFQLRRVLGSQGCIAPYSIATNGVTAFWRGPNGIYRFDGVKTTLISFLIHPLFEPAERSLYPTTVFQKAEDSVGVIHNNKYRCAVVQHGEGDIDINNFEYVYDFVADGGKGGWFQRSDRKVAMYANFSGEGDNSELFFVPSDTSNTLFQAEVEDGNTRHDFSEVTLLNLFDTNFEGQCLSRHFQAKIQGRQHLDKHWNPYHFHYEPVGNIDVGIKFFTSNNHVGELAVVTMQRKLDPHNLTEGIPLDGTFSLVSGDFDEKQRDTMSAAGDANQGVEIWYLITQGQEARDLSKFTGVGRRLGIGNFEPTRVRRVGFGFKEGNL